MPNREETQEIDLQAGKTRKSREVILEACDVSFRYGEKSSWILEGYNLKLAAQERTALVGPSGCGKSTLSKLLAGYEKPEKGKVLWRGKPLPQAGYCPVQMIGQHPEQAVNPRWKMEKILRESWNPGEELLEKMGIEKAWMKRWPIELSGGELQRFCIARVLGPQTEFLICDEISTMLDVITQAQIWQVLLEEAERRKMGMLVITHNRALAERVCDRILEF